MIEKYRYSRVCHVLLITAIIGTGPVACSSTPDIAFKSAVPLTKENTSVNRETKFDIALEVQGFGVRFEKDKIYGYARASRVFTGNHTAGVKVRFYF